LPPEPKIFHGRESEVSDIIRSFVQEPPRIAILGAGGLGKTSLARAVLHHPEVTARYDQHRVFIACDTASTSVQLAAVIGAHIGLKPGRDLTQPVIVHFRRAPPSLLILDNLETIWEPRETREDLEIFLSLLADIDHLALIITMRGAERPARVRWTRPFLQPLAPLSLNAARKMFIDIADDGYSPDDVDKVLILADNMPLAIDLLAHLVDYEGLPSVLERWETESTSLISEGHNKGSNLDLSISLSLASPRITSQPHARDLLSLLSMLPDGLADIDLTQSQLPLVNPLACKAALLRTSLAYVDPRGQLKVLAPIREYVRTRHPPMALIVQPILKHFYKLLEIYDTYVGTVPGPGIVARIESNFANIQNILLDGLNPTNPELTNAIYCTCQFDRFSRLTGHGQSQLMHHIPNILPQPKDSKLEVYFLTQLFQGQIYCSIPNADVLVKQALECFPQFEDPDVKCGFYVQRLLTC
ncbi:P-loop containing nucleoside triphosphate hydrolase protein, partial [Mycena latifolia]